jgi:hypothetical protein
MAFCNDIDFLPGSAMFTLHQIITALGWPGTSMMKQWLMRRAVRSLFARHDGAQEFVSVQVFISARLRRTSPTAWRQHRGCDCVDDQTGNIRAARGNC